MPELLHEVGLQSHEDLGKVDAQHVGRDGDGTGTGRDETNGTGRTPPAPLRAAATAATPPQGRGGAGPFLGSPALPAFTLCV